MSLTERSQELIHKYLEGLASEADIAELEGLLSSDADVAAEFAAAARLEAGLASYFRQQYKIDQVAALLNASETPAEGAGASTGCTREPQLPSNSTFVPRLDRLAEARRATGTRRLADAGPRWKSIAAAALVLIVGSIAVWSAKHGKPEPLRLVSGRLTQSGQEMSFVPEDSLFEVAGEEAAVIELPGGAHMELDTATRGSIRHDRDGLIVNLDSGGGKFHIPAGKSGIRVETKFGVVTTVGAQFSLTLIDGPPAHSTQAAGGAQPSMTVAVLEGMVTVERGSSITKISAGDQRVFLRV
jgi:hypothetical protein